MNNSNRFSNSEFELLVWRGNGEWWIVAITRGKRCGESGGQAAWLNLTWILRTGRKNDRVVEAWRKERKSEEMEEITFDFELLGSVTLSPPRCLPRRGRRRFLPPHGRPVVT